VLQRKCFCLQRKYL